MQSGRRLKFLGTEKLVIYVAISSELHFYLGALSAYATRNNFSATLISVCGGLLCRKLPCRKIIPLCTAQPQQKFLVMNLRRISHLARDHYQKCKLMTAVSHLITVPSMARYELCVQYQAPQLVQAVIFIT